MPDLEHAAAPDRDARLAADGLNLTGLCVAPDTPEFHVYDAAGADLYCLTGVIGRFDRLVEADRRLYLSLQLCVVEHIVVGQGLFEHHQIKLVHAFEQIDVGKSVRRIGVAHQPDIAKFFTHLPDDVVVPTRTDLDLDASVTGVELGLDLVKKLLDRVLYADRNAAFDLGACPPM